MYVFYFSVEFLISLPYVFLSLGLYLDKSTCLNLMKNYEGNFNWSMALQIQGFCFNYYKTADK